jgi:3-hydroxyacyl-CoA dehydrogenase
MILFYQEAAQKFISEAVGRLHTATRVNEAIGTADLVVEAVVENIQLKQKLFKEFDALAPESTIFASNTSSLPIGEIFEVNDRSTSRFAIKLYKNN